MQAEEPFPKD